jgi:hypothetical protein
MRGNIKISEAVRDTLDDLRKKHGHLTEEIVVKASKSPKSPLYPMFLWDDTERAAHLGRLEIARYLIVSIRVLPTEAQELNVSTRIRKYHGELGGGYFDVRDVVTQESLRQQLLRSALRDLQAFHDRYKALSELSPVFQAISEIEKIVGGRVKAG